jgi:hypothetical protein
MGKITKAKRTGGVVQVIAYLPSTHKALSSNPSTDKEKNGSIKSKWQPRQTVLLKSSLFSTLNLSGLWQGDRKWFRSSEEVILAAFSSLPRLSSSTYCHLKQGVLR